MHLIRESGPCFLSPWREHSDAITVELEIGYKLEPEEEEALWYTSILLKTWIFSQSSHLIGHQKIWGGHAHRPFNANIMDILSGETVRTKDDELGSTPLKIEPSGPHIDNTLPFIRKVLFPNVLSFQLQVLNMALIVSCIMKCGISNWWSMERCRRICSSGDIEPERQHNEGGEETRSVRRKEQLKIKMKLDSDTTFIGWLLKKTWVHSGVRVNDIISPEANGLIAAFILICIVKEAWHPTCANVNGVQIGNGAFEKCQAQWLLNLKPLELNSGA
ncbi:hypothetical protein B0H19DRAFT_1070387 [Mycena capillaripes]|nr:hypothetical protein B0H19DRAFT_1070387 [Mycena capillaripes]